MVLQPWIPRIPENDARQSQHGVHPVVTKMRHAPKGATRSSARPQGQQTTRVAGRARRVNTSVFVPLPENSTERCAMAALPVYTAGLMSSADISASVAGAWCSVAIDAAEPRKGPGDCFRLLQEHRSERPNTASQSAASGVGWRRVLALPSTNAHRSMTARKRASSRNASHLESMTNKTR